MANSKIRISLKELKSGLNRAFGPATPDICFVTGVARSGTSAMAQWLGQQPKVVSFNETRILLGLHQMMSTVERFKALKNNEVLLKYLTREMAIKYYRYQKFLIGKKILLDKEPYFPLTFDHQTDYSNFLTFLLNNFPELRILGMIREPLSTIWSMTQRKWGYSINEISTPQEFSLAYYIRTWSDGVEELAKFKDNPRFLFCKYNLLGLSPELHSAKITTFFGIKLTQPFPFAVNSKEAFTEGQRIRIIQDCLPSLLQFYTLEELSALYPSQLMAKIKMP